MAEDWSQSHFGPTEEMRLCIIVLKLVSLNLWKVSWNHNFCPWESSEEHRNMFASRGFSRTAWNLLVLVIDPDFKPSGFPSPVLPFFTDWESAFFFWKRFLTCTLFLWFRIKLRLVVLSPSSLGGLSPSQGTLCLESITQKLTHRSRHFSNFGWEQSRHSHMRRCFSNCLNLSWWTLNLTFNFFTLSLLRSRSMLYT